MSVSATARGAEVTRGTPPCDDTPPMPILGYVLAAVLQARRVKHLRRCQSGRIDGGGCRVPGVPVGDLAESPPTMMTLVSVIRLRPRRPRAVRLLSIDRPVITCLRCHEIRRRYADDAPTTRVPSSPHERRVRGLSAHGCCARRPPRSRRTAGRESSGSRRRRVPVRRQPQP